MAWQPVKMAQMVIIINKKGKPSLQVQEGQSPQKHIPIYLNPTKDVEVWVETEYLPILGKKVKKFFDDLNAQRQKDGKIHIFEITDCLRKGMLIKQNPDAVQLTIWDYMNLIQGLLSEKKLVDILAYDSGTDETEYQKDIDFSGISAHPDYLEGDTVFELKSTNKIKPLILSDDTVKNYIRQVTYYMILMNIEKGRILVRYNLPHFPENVGRDDEFCAAIADKFHRFTGDDMTLYKLMFHKDTGQFPFFSIGLKIPLDAPVREMVKKGLLEITKPTWDLNDVSQLPRLDGSIEGINWKCNNYCTVKDLCHTLPDEQTDPIKRIVLLNKHLDNSVEKKIFRGRKNQPVDIS